MLYTAMCPVCFCILPVVSNTLQHVTSCPLNLGAATKKSYVIGVLDATAALADHRIRRHGFDLRINQSCCIALAELLRCDQSSR